MHKFNLVEIESNLYILGEILASRFKIYHFRNPAIVYFHCCSLVVLAGFLLNGAKDTPMIE